MLDVKERCNFCHKYIHNDLASNSKFVIMVKVLMKLYFSFYSDEETHLCKKCAKILKQIHKKRIKEELEK